MTAEPRRDRDALTVLLLMAVIVTAVAMGDATRYIRGDWPAIFFPLYTFLGEQLRALTVPGWNPHQFSGAPFAGDPSSGWGYLPAILSYALLPPVPATTAFIGFHILLSAAAAYMLARMTGLGIGAAFVTGAAFAFPWQIPAAAGLVLFFQVTTWIPVALIGVELALQPGSPSRRFGGVALGGLAISQVLAAWLGQAAYYALLVIAGWVAWRTLVTPPVGWSWRQRLGGLLGVGLGSFLAGVALDAAALFIRLDVNSRSNVPGGVYQGVSRWADTKTGREWDEIIRALAGGFSEASWRYTGAVVLVLALLAPFVASRWPPLLFWLITGAAAIALALPTQTPIHAVNYALLPRFETLHSHLPGRVLLVMPLVAAMLAGATVNALVRGVPSVGRRRPLLLVPAAALAVIAGVFARAGTISQGSFAAALAGLAVCAVAIALPIWGRAVLLPAVLTALVLWDPTGRVVAAGWGPDAGPERSLWASVAGDVDGFLDANGAATFIAAATRDEPGRYAGYDPALLPDAAAAGGELPPQGYRNFWLGPVNWLLVFNWATWFGLDDVQGHNAVQPLRYVEYINALNGHPQEYHETDLFPTAFGFPLFNPLNLRYLIVPANAADRPELAPLTRAMAAVYQDEHVLVLANPGAFPRAWLVHEARQVSPGEALPLLASGAIDPRQIALLEAPPPPATAPTAAATERVRFVASAANETRYAVSAAAPALLVIGEVWDPGWTAMVDGAPAPVLLANHTFRAVPVPAGEHEVVLRYDPPQLRLGIAVSAATALLLIAAWIALVFRERRTDERDAPP